MKAVTIAALALACALPAMAQDKPAASPSPPPAAPPAAWRVECSGNGRMLECGAIQQMVRVENQSRQLVAQLVARLSADTHAPILLMQLPLGINVAEGIQLQVDAGKTEKYPVQTCTNAGCLANVPLKDALLAAMRAGTILKVIMQDGAKRSITIEVPLLGFSLAYDKATK
ncbi:MAG: invasion associated locus B family protein [Proteobacteria bacterium]|nr:invasion associated locus B family protein [Pseudomonadota bacterium]